MKKAIDVVIEIHVRDEIERLKKDIDQKCRQIADLIVDSGDGEVVYEMPKFYRKKKKQLIEIEIN